jgi:D-aminopeptidase
VVRDTLAHAHLDANPAQPFSLPVVGETYDGHLNDTYGQHVRAEHVEQALATAVGGAIEQGCVGGGTGMICHGFKGGIGTSSRVVETPDGEWTVGALVQANHGARKRLVIDGVPVGALIGPEEVPLPDRQVAGSGSIIVVVATDAPLLPHQCAALAKRASFGIARTGGAGEHSSGDFAIAFSTANRLGSGHSMRTVEAVNTNSVTPLYYATIEATEQAIVNALLAAETMRGADGHTVYALPRERLAAVFAEARAVA